MFWTRCIKKRKGGKISLYNSNKNFYHLCFLCDIVFPFLEDRAVRLPLPIECVTNFEDDNVDDADDDKLVDLLNLPDAGGPGTTDDDDKLPEPAPAPADAPLPLFILSLDYKMVIPFGG